MGSGRTLHVTPLSFGEAGVFGGGERLPLALATAMAKKIPTSLLGFGRTYSRVLHGDLEVITVPRRGRYRGSDLNPLSERYLTELWKAERVHTHQFETFTTTQALMLAAVRRSDVFTTDHGALVHNLRERLHVDGVLTKHLAVSQFSADLHPSLNGRSAVVYAGVDTTRFTPTTEQRGNHVVFLGRLLPHKGIDVLVRAMPDNVPLHVYGRIYDATYFALLQDLGREKDVVFHTNASDDDVLGALQRAAVAVLPTLAGDLTQQPPPRTELFGLALAEAMACGTPVIASRVGGMPEVVANGEAGLLVESGSVDELRDALELLLFDAKLRTSLGDAGLERVRSHFTWDLVADRCIAEYGL
jgi:glycosyltransferase involved in cell wall biosynthesis